jgi:starch-binding outer membrane protein, SusD/RagB family
MKKIIVTILVAGSFSSCDVLDQAPRTSVSPSNFYQTIDDAEAVLASAYDAFQGGDGGYYGFRIHAVNEMTSDNCTTVNPDVAELENLTWNSSSYTINQIFGQLYIAVNRANAVIAYVPGIDAAPQERRDQIVGEAYFLRALHYFNLVQLFGDVPLRTEPSESGASEEVALPRNSVEEVYEQIVSDLLMAEQLTVETYNDGVIDRAHATRRTVNALQAKVYLTMQNWAEARTAAAKVLNGGYTLPDFASLFPPDNQDESIFEIQFAGADDGGFILPDLILPSPPASYSFAKFDIPTTELISYADTVNDLRWSYTGENIFGGRNHVSFINNGPGGGNDDGYFIFKWRNTNFFNSVDNFCVLRLADVILMYAEASNEELGPNADALEKLNDIRVRAGLDELTLTELSSKEAFRNEVDRQRRLELAFEGHRWFDLLRYEAHEAAGGAHEVTALDIIEQKRGSRDRNYLVLPIPINEINNNRSINQNPGY